MAKKDDSQSRSRGKLELEQTMSTSEVAGYLETLAQGMRDGVVYVEDDAEGFRFPVIGTVDVEARARQGKRKTRIKLSLAFRADQSGEAPEPSNASPAESNRAPAQPATTIPDEMSF